MALPQNAVEQAARQRHAQQVGECDLDEERGPVAIWRCASVRRRSARTGSSASRATAGRSRCAAKTSHRRRSARARAACCRRGGGRAPSRRARQSALAVCAAGASRPRQDRPRIPRGSIRAGSGRGRRRALTDHRRQRQAVREDARADHDQNDTDQKIGELHRLTATATATLMSVGEA